MARSRSRSTRYVSTTIRKIEYLWPEQQLLAWRFIMYGTGGTLLGVFAVFMQIQQQLGLGIPWIFPFGITVGALTIVFLLIMDALLIQRALLPGWALLGAFILLVLYMAGLVETGIQLFGNPSNINGNCNRYVNGQPSSGVSLATFAWLQQRGICQSWSAVFAFWLIGVVFLVWLMILAGQVWLKKTPVTARRRHSRRVHHDPEPAQAATYACYPTTPVVPVAHILDPPVHSPAPAPVSGYQWRA